MKTNDRSKLAGQYLAALKDHIKHGPESSAQAAQELGAEAVAMGLETLDMAKIHDVALATLVSAEKSSLAKITQSAATFFDEAMTPIERTHPLAVEASADLDEMKAELGQRTQDLADSRRDIQCEMVGRDNAVAALKTSEEASAQLLRDSRLLEAHLQEMARKILAATEDERKKMSLQLQDEIAQTLLGIHVRLLALKKDVAASNANVSREIIITQRFVAQSVKIINQLAHEFGSPP